MTSTLEAYSNCTIRFVPNNIQASVRQYSDRSLIELRQDEGLNFFLRAVDIDKNKQEIFNIQIKTPDIYKFGLSAKQSDEVPVTNGSFLLNLKSDSRVGFHEALKACLDKLAPVEEQPSKPNSKNIDVEKEILVDIYKLGESIENGKETKARDLAKKLVDKGVKLQIAELENPARNEKISIKVQIDGINPDIKDKVKENEYSIDVYSSTKVHELRTLFKHVYDFPVANQYFFVNGHLAHAESTMNDLDVKDNSLFVLFLT